MATTICNSHTSRFTVAETVSIVEKLVKYALRSITRINILQ